MIKDYILSLSSLTGVIGCWQHCCIKGLWGWDSWGLNKSLAVFKYTRILADSIWNPIVLYDSSLSNEENILWQPRSILFPVKKVLCSSFFCFPGNFLQLLFWNLVAFWSFSPKHQLLENTIYPSQWQNPIIHSVFNVP